LIKEKKAALVPSTENFLYQQTKRPSQKGPTKYQKEKRSHEKTGLPASNKQEHQAQKLQSLAKGLPGMTTQLKTTIANFVQNLPSLIASPTALSCRR
jgi:hypothetical protein